MRSILTLSLLLLAGCTMSVDNTKTDNKPDTKPEPVHVQPTSEDIWAKAGTYVERGIITTPQELARYIKVLIDANDLTLADKAAFDRAYPDAPSDERTLDKVSDAAKVRGIK